jgi:hypothetical protein
MNPNDTLEERLEMLGSALRDRPTLTDRVMREVRQSFADGLVAKPAAIVPAQRAGRRWPFVTTTVAAITALVAIGLVTFPRPSVGWEEVDQAVKSQKWIRASVTYLGGQHATIWLSSARGIWAYKNDDRIEFSDGLQKVTYDYKTGAKQITKRRLSDEDQQRIFPVDFNRQDVLLSGWLFGEKVVEQHRHEVTEGGQKWIEFELVFWRGGNRGALRVDPKTRLPVSLLVASTNDARSVRWVFDYPTDGPGDVYAMGAPAGAKIDDRAPSNEGARALDGMAASRSLIGDFRLDVAVIRGSDSFYRVWRKGGRWRIDLYLPKRSIGPLAEPAPGADLGDWFETQLAQSDQYPRYLCDGGTVYEQTWSEFGTNAKSSGWHPSPHVAPTDLLSATGASGVPNYVTVAAKIFPDRFGNFGYHYEFDAHPADAPGCVLWKLSLRLAAAVPLVGHEWYYLDPRKGYAVVRTESFNLPAEAPANPESTPFRQTLVMEDFRQSPGGFWYPTVIRDTNSAVDPNVRRNPADKPVRTISTLLYHFDFNPPLPDSLFTIDEVRNSKTAPSP